MEPQMTDVTKQPSRWRRIITREPLKVWTVLFAATALTIQSLTYSVTSWFYSAFNVTPEEVGFSYTDILGRNALEIAFVSIVGLGLLAAVSMALAFLGVVVASRWVQVLRRQSNREPA